MKPETQVKVDRVVSLVRSFGRKGVRRAFVDDELQKAVTVAIETGLIRREVRKFRKGVVFTWLIDVNLKNSSSALPGKSNPPPPLPRHIQGLDLEAQEQWRQESMDLNEFGLFRAQFRKLIALLPAFKQISTRINAIELGDIEALTLLKTKVLEYYNLPADIDVAKLTHLKNMPQPGTVGTKETEGTFRMDRADLIKTILTLNTNGTISEKHKKEIGDKIKDIPYGDNEKLSVLKAAIFSFYKLDPETLAPV